MPPLVGALAGDPSRAASSRLLFPGTHSKHVSVANGRAFDFKTYMTGEFFDLLARQSVLANSVSAAGAWEEAENQASFAEGVREGARTNPLQACFHVRVRGLFGPGTRETNFHYLSGLLIGSELGELAKDDPAELIIVAAPAPAVRYEQALRALGWPGEITVREVQEALLRGQARIAKNSGWLESP
jgi:2-dehydro-3-deoxygalactonokinase